ncbi:MAG: hypothetical protein HUU38_26910, partial [Anaerolineales bacterium]|nr:hypothetical protein [Anaerolineales bacterium]
MATIPLRDYCREIENMIDKGHTDEAIGHCRHILKYFPKHIETYRLLGKAYLESKQLGDAADIFQRVLSSIPNDFVSHIGMSIIREDEGNLDAGLWHMERAYEVQPSNIAIQDELKRLYAQRDGQEPAKIRLTRGALAHMYANGHLYSQAIAELRAALATDPKRLDLLALLGKMYHLDRQQTQAAKIASQLLSKLPYCYIANQILADILTTSQRSSEAAPHLTRLQELDPYYKHLSAQYATVDVIPSGLIVLEFLDWEATKGGLISQPAWATSIGVDISNAPASETLPEWLSPADAGGQTQKAVFDDLAFDDQLTAFASPITESGSDWGTPSAPEVKPDHSSLKNNLDEAKNMREEEEDNIPDWMKDAGWSQRDSDSPEEPPLPLFDDEDEPPATQDGIAKANIPDWLKAMAPSDIADTDEEAAAPADDVPDWLKGFNTAETAPTRIPPATPSTPPARVTPPKQAAEVPPTDLPDWLQEDTSLDPTQSDSGTLEKADMPDWLKDLNPSAPTAKAGNDLPDWLGGLEPSASAPEEYSLDQLEESTAPDWLQDFGDEVVSSTLPSAKPTPAMPSWLTEEEPTEAEIEDFFESPAGETMHSNLSWLDEVEEEPDDPSLHSGVTDWLSEIEPATDDATPEAAPAEIPDWLQGLGEDLPAASATFEEEVTPDEDLAPSFDLGDLGKDTGQEIGLEDDAMAWLESLAAKQGAKEEELLTARESREDTHLPSWLEAMTDEPDASAELAEEDDLVPDWLKGMETEEPAASFLETEQSAGFIEEEEPEPDLFALEEPLPTLEEDFSFTSTEPAEMPALDDEDAAMAWLESLAAKQGAKEEELLTAPTDRPDDVPDWLKNILHEEEPPAAEDVFDLPETEIEYDAALETAISARTDLANEADELPAEAFALEAEAPAPEEPQAPVAEESDMLSDDAALAWLESLAMKHGVNENELLTAAESRPESTPDWVNVIAEEARAEEAAQTAAELIQSPAPEEAADDTEWLNELLVDEAPEGQTLAPSDEAPDWLTDSAANWIAATVEPTATPPSDEALTDEEELPAWLLEEEPAPVETPETPTWVLEETVAEPPAEKVDAPSWIFEETTEEALEEPEVPAWILEESAEEPAPSLEMPAWLIEEATPTAEATTPVEDMVEELPEEVAPILHLQPEPVAETPVQEVPVAEPPVLVKVEAGETLSLARATLAKGDVALATQHYTTLIKNDQNVDEAITDITE